MKMVDDPLGVRKAFIPEPLMQLPQTVNEWTIQTGGRACVRIYHLVEVEHDYEWCDECCAQ